MGNDPLKLSCKISFERFLVITHSMFLRCIRYLSQLCIGKTVVAEEQHQGNSRSVFR